MSNSRQFKTSAELGQALTSFWAPSICRGCLLGSTKLTKLGAAEITFLVDGYGGVWVWLDQIEIKPRA